MTANPVSSIQIPRIHHEKSIDRRSRTVPFVSAIVPAYNESSGLVSAIRTMADELSNEVERWEIIVIDDGSSDATFERIAELATADPRIKGATFSRNFGKEAALLAGLRYASGDVIITIDADLQHPPSLIGDMVRAWQSGNDIVHAIKRDRTTDSAGKKLIAGCINYVISKLGNINLHNASDFKLLDRKVVDIIAFQLPERERFFRGLTSWLGFSEAYLEFDVPGRQGDQSKWTLGQLIELSVTALTSFTSLPLRLVTLMGAITLILGALIGGEALWSWVAGNTVSGFVTLISTLLIIGSFIMISLGIIGEYIAKIYEEAKARPLFLVKSTIGLAQESTTETGIERRVRSLS